MTSVYSFVKKRPRDAAGFVRRVPVRRRPAREGGFVLIAIIGALAIMLIIITSYLPNVMRAVRREREEEMLFRGQQIVNAVQKYQQQMGGRYPVSLQQLSDGALIAGNKRVRFLRTSALKDPMVMDGKWKLVRYRDPSIQRFFDAYFKHLGLAPNPMVLAKYTGVLPKGMPIPEGGNMAMNGMPQAQLPQRFAARPQTINPTVVGEGAVPAAGPPGTAGVPAIPSTFGQFGGSTEEGGLLAGPILGVVSRSKNKSVRVFYEDLDHYEDWPFIYIPELSSLQILNQDQRITALMTPILFPSDPMALVVQMMQGQGGPRMVVNPRYSPQGGAGAGGPGTPPVNIPPRTKP